MANMEVEEHVEKDLRDPDTVGKYKLAADICNRTMQGVLGYAKPGMRALDLCAFGDQLIVQQCSQVFKSKKTEKGIAFPTCVSINDCVCHYSPLSSETNTPELKPGDMVKVDLGAHIDGFIAVTAHTFVVQGETPAPATGRAADVLMAAYTAADAALRLVKPGATNQQVTELIKAVGEDFGVTAVQGVLMHQMKQFVIDGNDVVLQREEVDQKVDSFEFEEGKVYTLDVVFSTGEGKPIQRDARTTVFKRAVDQEYRLKMKASRYVFNEVNRRFSTLPFSIRAIEDEKQARMGVVECIKHNLLTTYPVLYEKPGDMVAHFKFTVLLLPGKGAEKVTGLTLDASQVQTEKKARDEVLALQAAEFGTKKKAKKKVEADSAMETE